MRFIYFSRKMKDCTSAAKAAFVQVRFRTAEAVRFHGGLSF
jgi:hypothetical protein